MHQTYEFPMSPLLKEIVYASYLRAKKDVQGYDADTRSVALTKKLLKTLGLSFDKWPRVTITGSKGKGSTAVLLASILSASGEKVGLVTSPHLRRFNERIKIDGQCVTDEELEQAVQEIEPAVRSLTAKIRPPKYIGPNGIVLALAAHLFKKYNVTAVVVEAGRGGEYDESRLVEGNISLITPIMLKHADKIGPGLVDIARTKTLITYPKSIIITALQKPEVLQVIKSVAGELSSSVLEVGKAIEIIEAKHSKFSAYDMHGDGFTYKNLTNALAGSYQIENSAAAVLAARLLMQFGTSCTTEGIQKGLRQVRWPGRSEFIQKKPWIFLDGAINKTAAKYVLESIKGKPAEKRTAVIAIHNRQDLEEVCSVLAGSIDSVILTEVHTDTLTWDKKALIKSAKKYFKEPLYIPDVKDSFKYIQKTVKKNEGALLLGHQSFVGEALAFWDIDTCRLW
jgi:dihydrofolate synthase / folylpolyglutamate synthase